MWKCPDNANMWVVLTKIKYTFEEGNTVEGIEIRLAPGVRKFITMSGDRLEITQAVGNKVADWYLQADFGDDTGLTAYFD